MLLRRRPLAWILLVVMLFAQLATAAYACEQKVSTTTALATLAAPDVATEAAVNCEEMRAAMSHDEVNPTPLCVDHCTHGLQATVDAHTPVPHWLPVLLLSIAIVLPTTDDTYRILALLPTPGMRSPVVPTIPILLGRFLS